jgi:ribosomal protein S18 acetylase RimI-like enzyme
MSHELVRDDFTEADWDEVQDFRCGELYYQKEVSDWLKGTAEPAVESALNAIHHPTHPSRVWLYRDQDENMVGFGALARSEWRWTRGKDPWIPVTVITWCAIHSDFQGDNYEPKHMRYSNQIMDDLIGEASEDAERYPVLGLFVQEENVGAIKLYRRFKFFSEGLEGFTDPKTKMTYVKMALVLDQKSLLGFIEQRKMKRG